jgi:hypothetical protein
VKTKTYWAVKVRFGNETEQFCVKPGGGPELWILKSEAADEADFLSKSKYIEWAAPVKVKIVEVSSED